MEAVRRSGCCALAALVLLGLGSAPSAGAAPADARAQADSVVAAAAAAMGAADVRAAITSLRARAHGRGPDATYEMEVQAASGGRVSMEQRGDQGGASVVVVNGADAWSRTKDGFERIERDVAAMVRAHAFQWTALHVEDAFSALAADGEAPFGGRHCRRLRGLDELEMPCAVYFDAETHLLAGYEVADPIEEGTVVVRFTQWRRVAGVLLPSEVIASDASGDFVLDFYSVTVNDVDKDRFDVPAALRR